MIDGAGALGHGPGHVPRRHPAQTKPGGATATQTSRGRRRGCHEARAPITASTNFCLTTLEGKTIKLSDYAGKVVLVNLWAPLVRAVQGRDARFREAP